MTGAEAVAGLLRYPGHDYRERIELAWVVLSTAGEAEASSALSAFNQEIRDFSDQEIEELFTATFDLNPVASLDVGWHLHGEAYERGRLLARLRELCLRHEVDERGELPDNLPTVLTLLSLVDGKQSRILGGGILLPAIDKMVPVLEKAQNPYRHVLLSARAIAAAYAVQETHA